MTCEWESETDFHSRTCILGQCDKNCEIVNINADLKKSYTKSQNKKVHCYVLETVEI